MTEFAELGATQIWCVQSGIAEQYHLPSDHSSWYLGLSCQCHHLCVHFVVTLIVAVNVVIFVVVDVPITICGTL